MKTTSEQIQDITKKISIDEMKRCINDLRYQDERSFIRLSTAAAITEIHKKLFPEEYGS